MQIERLKVNAREMENRAETGARSPRKKPLWEDYRGLTGKLLDLSGIREFRRENDPTST